MRTLTKKEKEVLDGLFTGTTIKIDDIKKSDLADEFYLVVKVEK